MVRAGIGLQKWFKKRVSTHVEKFSFKLYGKNSVRGLNSLKSTNDDPLWSDISGHGHFRNHSVSIKVISAVDFVVTSWVYQTWNWGRQEKVFYSTQPGAEVDADFGLSSPQILESPWTSWSLRE